MIRVAPIKLQVGPKVLWFDPNDIDIHEGDFVIVKTERGSEYGRATSDILEVSDELVTQLKSPLKPVLRLADEDDRRRARELNERGEEALSVFKEFAAQTNEDMHPVVVEFLFDGDKAVFYFEAEERVDFRELVRKLAAHFHIRIDMRQIGVRDGARIVGGLGHCGQELCCKRLGGEFSPVSIRMAKEQNLSLNPQKISGVCGRLMCCLRYEYETYKEVNSRAPKINAKIEVPDGIAKVTEINVPCERVSLLLGDGRTVKIPLAEMELPETGKRPNRVSEEVFEKYTSTNPLDVLESSTTLEVAEFTGEDKLADRSAPARRPKQANRSSKEGKDSSRKPRRRRKDAPQDKKKGEGKPSGSKDAKETSSKQRSGGQGSSGKRSQGDRGQNQGQNQNRRRGGAKRNRGDEAAPNQGASRNKTQRRPGQKSSGLRGIAAQPSTSAKQEQGAPRPSQGAETTHRKSRRRSHKAGGESHEDR